MVVCMYVRSPRTVADETLFSQNCQFPGTFPFNDILTVFCICDDLSLLCRKIGQGHNRVKFL